MTKLKVQSVALKNYIEGAPTPDSFVVDDSEIEDTLKNGEILLQVLVMSVDPYLNWTIRKPAFKPNDKGIMIMAGFVAGKVVASKNKEWKRNDLIGLVANFSTYVVLTEADVKGKSWKLTGHITEDQVEKGVGVLGMPGATVWAGIVDILKPNKGDVIFCSAASGAVGHLVAQVAKIRGAGIAIGSCGGEEKSKLLVDKFGYDHAIDYTKFKTAEELANEIRRVSPAGIDMVFENVGGLNFDAAFATLKTKGRVAICGAISGYNQADVPTNTISLPAMIYTQQRIEGFIVFDYLFRPEWLRDMSKWLKEGKLVSQETVVHGIDNLAEAFCSLFQSGTKHVGKLVIKV